MYRGYFTVYFKNVSLYSQYIAANGGQHQTGNDDTVIMKHVIKNQRSMEYAIWNNIAMTFNDYCKRLKAFKDGWMDESLGLFQHHSSPSVWSFRYKKRGDNPDQTPQRGETDHRQSQRVRNHRDTSALYLKYN